MYTEIDTKKAQIKNKTYEISPEIEACAKEVFTAKRLSIFPARVRYVKTSPHISKTIAARCNKASNFVTFFGECDFVIEVSGDLWDALSEDLQKILLYHELLHIFCVQNEKTGEWNFSLRDHDINEFKEIIREYGIDWLDKVKEAFIESGGFDPDEIDNLGI